MVIYPAVFFETWQNNGRMIVKNENMIFFPVRKLENMLDVVV